MQLYGRLGNMTAGFSPYLGGPRHSLLQYRVEFVEQVDRRSLTGPLAEVI